MRDGDMKFSRKCEIEFLYASLMDRDDIAEIWKYAREMQF